MNRLHGPKISFDGDDPANLVVLLHGYGANGNDMIALATTFARIMPGTAFHAPTAPFQCDHFPDYFQWYRSSNVTAASFESAAASLGAFLDDTMSRYRLDESRTTLVGFSQGTPMALHFGLRRSNPFAGLIGFSGSLELPDALAAEIRSRPPTLLIHGDSDQNVPMEETHRAAQALRANGVEVAVHIARDVDHRIDPTGISVAWRFLYKVNGLPVPP